MIILNGPNGRILEKVSNHEINEDGSVDIPDDITAIADNAFSDCLDLQEINIPDNVLTIGDAAFEGCVKLKKVTLSNNLISIGNAVFSKCESIEHIDIPDSVLTIGDEAFQECAKLKKVKLSNNLISIGYWAFADCESIEHLDIPNSVSRIDAYAFYYCKNLKSIKLPVGWSENLPGDTLGFTRIPYFAFMHCSALKEIDIPHGVVSLGSRAFGYCTALKQISIPDGILTIAADAFLDSRVEMIIIDSSNEQERVRITNLLPENLRNKVVIYSKKELIELLEKQLSRIISAVETNPLNPLIDRMVLPPEIVERVNKFVGKNNLSYQNALAAIKRVRLPRIQDGEKGKRAYEEKIEKIINECITKGHTDESYSFLLKALTTTAAVGGLALVLAAMITVLVAGAIPLATTFTVVGAACLGVAASTFFYHSYTAKEESIEVSCLNSL